MTPRRPDPTVLHINPAVSVTPTLPRGRSIVIHPYLYAALGLLLLFGTIQVSKETGFWTTSGRVTGTGEAVVLTGNDPLEIKGWMTIEQVATAYQVRPADLKSATGIPSEVPDSTALRDVERLAPGFSAQGVRDWLLARQK
jgi:hypothetical protein